VIPFTIDKNFLGTEKNLLISDSMKWSDDILTYHFNGYDSNVSMLFKLSKINEPEQPRSIINSLKIVMKNHESEQILWKKFVGNDFYKLWLTQIVDDIKKIFNNEDILTFYNKERLVIMRKIINTIFEKAFLENDLKCKNFMILNRKKWFIDCVNEDENNFK